MILPQAQIDWALRYDGYQRIASTQEQLQKLLRSPRNSYRAHGRVPDWCGVDLLRGWAYLLARVYLDAGGDGSVEEWAAVLLRLKEHPGALGSDRPPSDSAIACAPLPTLFTTAPKTHRDSAFLAAKQARWWEAHVAPVNQLVDQIRIEIADQWATEHGDEAPPVFVPYVDPDSGGVRAKVLFLLESPAGPAALGSQMLSPDNNDETAKNIWNAYKSSGMPRTFGLPWNAVPWYVGDGKKNKGVTAAQVERGRRYRDQLLDLTPDLRVVLALGKPAQASISPMAGHLRSRGIEIIPAMHPSPIQVGVTRGRSLVELNAQVALAYRLACASEEVPYRL